MEPARQSSRCRRQHHLATCCSRLLACWSYFGPWRLPSWLGARAKPAKPAAAPGAGNRRAPTFCRQRRCRQPCPAVLACSWRCSVCDMAAAASAGGVRTVQTAPASCRRQLHSGHCTQRWRCTATWLSPAAPAASGRLTPAQASSTGRRSGSAGCPRRCPCSHRASAGRQVERAAHDVSRSAARQALQLAAPTSVATSVSPEGQRAAARDGDAGTSHRRGWHGRRNAG